ncbi:hypothetical protein [Neptuniibacter sp. QD37_11]|uniref:hypothetical protein n=1 Tax=Neptuniibacter sp. QD37_11 TaxID=3398209 RepID=UPI0039F500EB
MSGKIKKVFVIQFTGEVPEFFNGEQSVVLDVDTPKAAEALLTERIGRWVSFLFIDSLDATGRLYDTKITIGDWDYEANTQFSTFIRE